jgi:hypothetical protein
MHGVYAYKNALDYTQNICIFIIQKYISFEPVYQPFVHWFIIIIIIFGSIGVWTQGLMLAR